MVVAMQNKQPEIGVRAVLGVELGHELPEASLVDADDFVRVAGGAGLDPRMDQKETRQRVEPVLCPAQLVRLNTKQQSQHCSQTWKMLLTC